MASTHPDLHEEALRLIEGARQEGITMRLLGGLAIHHHCHTIPDPLQRNYEDLDVIVRKRDRRKLAAFFQRMGYEPNKVMNTLNEARQQFFDTARDRQVDVFVGDFDMCHKIPMEHRLDIEPVTVPLAELFLTKMQIVDLNYKDVIDVVTLLAEHEIGPGDEEMVNRDIIAGLCARDWGLYTTIHMNIEKVRRLSYDIEKLSPDIVSHVRRRLDALVEAMERAPKSMAWKMRAKIGTRVRWYQEVEEVRR